MNLSALTKIKPTLQEHFAAFVYLFVLAILNIGVVVFSGLDHIGKMALVAISFILFYISFFKLLKNFKISSIPKFMNTAIKKHGHLMLAGLCIAIGILDLIYLNGLPGLKLFSTQTTTEVVQLRGEIHAHSPKWMIYLSGFNIRCFFPFLILLLFVSRNTTLFIIFIFLGSFYAFGLLQKSFIIFLLLPTLIYALTKKKFITATLLTLLMALTISIVIIGSSDKVNTELQTQVYTEEELKLDERPFIVRIALGMSKRIFVTPGEMVAEWFNTIPSKKPFLFGDGYPLIPRLKGTEYRDYNHELYPIIRPKYAERGFEGSVNCATFMREYSNFGYIGLILSSLILSLFFAILNILFKNNLSLNLSINMMFILMLSSTNLWTLLLSGGWFMTIILFAIFKDSFNLNVQSTSNDKK